MNGYHRPSRAAARPVSVHLLGKLRLEDRRQHEVRSRLRHAVPYRRDPKRPFAAAGLRNVHPTYRIGSIPSTPQVFPELPEPALQPLRFDLLEGRPVHPGRPLPALRTPVRVLQHVRSADLVAQTVEPPRRLLLGFDVQLPLETPDRRWGC